MVLYHYTVMEHFKKIVESEKIKRATKHLGPKEKPAVHLSSNPEWEMTVKKTPLGLSDAVGLRNHSHLIPVRIKIEAEACNIIPWRVFKKRSGISAKMARFLEKRGKEMGADPKQWYCSFEDIPLGVCLSVEFWDGEWCLIPEVDREKGEG